MTLSSKSYETVHYEFRPAKQVERRMLLHALQNLMLNGFSIPDYQYTGMGSVFFIDFILFHRYLGITKFLSVEADMEIERRIGFNKPFGCVDIAMGDIADSIPALSPDMKHILWLDYDRVLTTEMTDAVILAAGQLPPGSILLVTVDVEPPGSPKEGKYDTSSWRKYFVEEFVDYVDPSSKKVDFAREKLPGINSRILEKAIRSGLNARANVSFTPLFNFLYADGHRMLSLGGMIVTDTERRSLEGLNRNELFFLRESVTENPYEIRVPLLSRKERLYLDREMPCDSNWSPDFEMKQEEIDSYREIYKYYPAYAEMLL